MSKKKDSRRLRKVNNINNNYNLQRKSTDLTIIKEDNNETFMNKKNLSQSAQLDLEELNRKMELLDKQEWMVFNHLKYIINDGTLVLDRSFRDINDLIEELDCNTIDNIPYKVINGYEVFKYNNLYYKIIDYGTIEITEAEYNGEIIYKEFDYANKEDVKYVQDIVIDFFIKSTFNILEFGMDSIVIDDIIRKNLFEKFPNKIKERVNRIIRNICLNFPKKIDRTLFEHEMRERFEKALYCEYCNGLDLNSFAHAIYNTNQNVYIQLIHDYRMKNNIQTKKIK